MGSRRQLAPRASKSGRAIAFTLSAPTQGKNWSLCLWDSRPVVKVGPLQAAKRRRRGELRTSSWKTTSSMLPLHVPSHELQLYILISYALHKLWSRDKRHAHMRRGKLSGTQTGSHNQRTALRPQSTSGLGWVFEACSAEAFHSYREASGGIHTCGALSIQDGVATRSFALSCELATYYDMRHPAVWTVAMDPLWECPCTLVEWRRPHFRI